MNDIRALDEITLLYTYPRLDINVSKAMNHLLKAPFCVHPKSGRVCVPVMFSDENDLSLGKFNPLNVPTLEELILELETGKKATQGEVPDCSLTEYLKYFEDFVDNMAQDNRLNPVKA
eukprot:Platyproteum_vivax@DN430_c0_g1_i2.p2